MAQYKMLDGNAAAVQAVSMAGVKVVSAYPITPQSPIAEKLSDLIAQGTLEAKYIRVESEHSALSCALGAQLTGVRAATATASVGLALMHEICSPGYAGGEQGTGVAMESLVRPPGQYGGTRQRLASVLL